jgi:16S rRNA (cytosine967-C5)-methyltransferase
MAKAARPAARDAALLRSMSSGVLRWHHRLQWQVSELLDRPLKAKDAELAALIRLGLFQLQWLRVPDHAAVSATVGAAEQLGRARAKGLVNAVLRRFLRERETLEQRMAEVPEALESYPSWMLDSLQADWPGQWRAITAAGNELPPMWLRVNESRISRSDYLGLLNEAEIAVTESEATRSAMLLKEPRPMESLPGYSDGLVAVQDAAAQLAAGYLALAPGQRVLDACAAPGGKSAHILETCPDIAELVTLDRDPGRLAALRESLARLGHEPGIIEGDGSQPSTWWDGQAFDRILLDAPCSALGVIRRHPDIKVRRQQRDVDQATEAQRELLERLWPLLAPGGMMLYAVCTTTHSETDRQIAEFLENTPDARLIGPGERQGRQILPGEANMDGFYYACLYKNE